MKVGVAVRDRVRQRYYGHANKINADVHVQSFLHSATV